MEVSIKKLTKHASHYFPLVGMILTTIIGFALFPYDKAFQLALCVAAASGYVAWGLVHHHIHRNLYLSVILEYIAVACLGVVIIFFVLFRA